MKEIVDKFDFAAVQAMYESINLRSASPLKPEKNPPASSTLLRAIPKVATASVARKDVYFMTPHLPQESSGRLPACTMPIVQIAFP